MSGRGLTWRAPTVQDAEALGRMHHQAWVDTYTTGLPADFFETHDEAWAIGRWREGLGTPLPEGAFRRAAFDEAGEVVAWGVGGPSRVRGELPPARDWELWGLYVAKPRWGEGIGHQLLVALLQDRPAELWVWDGNERALAFYRRHGFEPDGAGYVDERFPTLHEIRMVR